MAAASARTAWDDYRGAMADMYGRSSQEIISEPEVFLDEPPDDSSIDAAERASEALAEALAGELDSEDSARREFAVMRLLAAATVDLSIAHDLARFDSGDFGLELNDRDWGARRSRTHSGMQR